MRSDGSLNRGAAMEVVISALFRDSTRLREGRKRRPDLASFLKSLQSPGPQRASGADSGGRRRKSHEAPEPEEAARTRFLQWRPREPPPPPPPVAAVLKPVVPPKKFDSSTRKRGGDEKKKLKDDNNEVEEVLTDEFSSDEFESVTDDGGSSDSKANVISGSNSKVVNNKSNVYDVAEYVEGSSGISTGSESSQEIAKEGSSTSSEPPNEREDVEVEEEEVDVKKIEILISSSSWIDVRPVSEERKEEEKEEKEPTVKAPPRLKKLAKQIQKQNAMMMHRTMSEGDVTTTSNTNNRRKNSSSNNPKLYGRSSSRPEISAPVLVATTFNPNDAESHKVVSVADGGGSGDGDDGDDDIIVENSPSSKNSSSSKTMFRLPDAERVSFKELKKLSSFFPSLSSLTSSSSKANRSSFYVAEAVYEEAAAADGGGGHCGGIITEHIYEEIPERDEKQEEEQPDQVEDGSGGNLVGRPLPPIPELGENDTSNANGSSKKELNPSFPSSRRGGSMFGGASKHEILSYLRSAKARIGHSGFEMDPEDEEEEEMMESASCAGLLGRGQPGRVSCVSSSSESSSCSSGGSGSGAAARKKRPTSKFLRGQRLSSLGIATTIVQRADSGVGSEAGSSSGGSSIAGSLRRWKDAADGNNNHNNSNSKVVVGPVFGRREEDGEIGSCGERCQDCNLWMDKGSARCVCSTAFTTPSDATGFPKF